MRMMKEASEAGVTLAKYEYDALGRRIISWLDDEWRTVSLWSGNDSIYEIRQEWTTPPPNPPTETITRYVAVNGQYLAKLVGGYNSTQKFFHHTDIVGTVRAVTDSSGAVVVRYAYEPFGSLTTASGLVDGELHRFTGKPSDLETSLSYFNARYYDPTLGRFTSSDPAKDGLNWFVYCSGNPIVLVDQNGESKVTPTAVMGIFAHGRIGLHIAGIVSGSDPKAKSKINLSISDTVKLRPDLVVTWGDGTISVYETKPVSYMNSGSKNDAGKKQLANYVSKIPGAQPGKSIIKNGETINFSYLGDKTITLYENPGEPGMIYYEIDDNKVKNPEKLPMKVITPQNLLTVESIIMFLLLRGMTPSNNPGFAY